MGELPELDGVKVTPAGEVATVNEVYVILSVEYDQVAEVTASVITTFMGKVVTEGAQKTTLLGVLVAEFTGAALIVTVVVEMPLQPSTEVPFT